MPIDPVVGVIGAAAIAVGSAALYSRRTGEETSVGVDVDDDGNDDVSVDFGGGNPSKDEDTNVDEVSSTSEDVEEQANPTPSYVEDDYDELSDIKGIGATRAENLGKAGFSTPEDIYYAADENLTDVHGIGPRAIEYIRDDIGSVDENPNGEEGGESDNTNSPEESNDDASDENEDGDGEDDADDTADDEDASDEDEQTE